MVISERRRMRFPGVGGEKGRERERDFFRDVFDDK